MSDLWHVSVRGVTGDTVDLLVAAVHPDAGPLPAAKPFALRLLADAEPVWPGARDLVAGADLYAEAESAHRADRALAEVSVTDRRNVDFDEAAAQRRIKEGLAARGWAPDGPEWAVAFEAEWRDLWLDPDRVPSGMLHVRPADPAALAGLRPGLEWDSAAYG